MHSERIFHADKRVRTPKSQFWTPNKPEFVILGSRGFGGRSRGFRGFGVSGVSGFCFMHKGGTRPIRMRRRHGKI